MKRLCFTCDLKKNPELIEKYKEYHHRSNTWPEITKSIREAGVLQMEIFLAGNRLFMIMDTKDDFSLERKELMDAENSIVQRWESLMGKYQQTPEFTRNGEKWVLMEKIYDLEELGVLK
ncbi:L-rhamnose mutarotase [Sinomicrobium oceani]|uniref:L-rhamnose mutarotase n=1 Tax=Sinomicrobium oceani TaxID=1150368 RepID=UPI002DD44D6D|nr:L-rhamnose mutarotase [Sinomicrobium oceani]